MAGEQLQKYTRRYYIGLAMISGGHIIAMASALASLNNQQTAPPSGILIGSLAATGGFVLQILSHRHIGKAGRFLKESTLGQNLHLQGSPEGLGIGLAYRF